MAEQPHTQDSSLQNPLLRIWSLAQAVWRRIENIVFGIVLLAISIRILTTQLTMMQKNLQGTVEKIERTVLHIENMHQQNLRLMQRQDSILSEKDTVVVERILQYGRRRSSR